MTVFEWSPDCLTDRIIENPDTRCELFGWGSGVLVHVRRQVMLSIRTCAFTPNG